MYTGQRNNCFCHIQEVYGDRHISGDKVPMDPTTVHHPDVVLLSYTKTFQYYRKISRNYYHGQKQ